MEINEFIKDFAAQWDDTELDVLMPECEFHDLDEWSSLIGLAILNMVAKKYNVKLLPTELRSCVTIKELFDLVQSKL